MTRRKENELVPGKGTLEDVRLREHEGTSNLRANGVNAQLWVVLEVIN
jgi:hypothetical protein